MHCVTPGKVGACCVTPGRSRAKDGECHEGKRMKIQLDLDTDELAELKIFLEEESERSESLLRSWAGGPKYRDSDYERTERRKDLLTGILRQLPS